MSSDTDCEIAIIGAGIAGIATAYYLGVEQRKKSVLLIDYRPPMSYTSAQSGDNYRNWWPHPTMTAFTNDSIDLMERLSRDTQNVFNMTRRGYRLATRRSNVDKVFTNLQVGTDVDVVSGRERIRQVYPDLCDDIRNVIHIKRGGDISGQQLGALMLERFRDAGGKRLQGEATGVSRNGGFRIELQTATGTESVRAETIVNAAGPFAKNIAAMLDVELPVRNVYQQKVAFDDRRGAVARDMPFTIDLDETTLAWSDEEREMLESDEELSWLVGAMPGGTHCRPDGGENGTWVKLGWAYNDRVSDAQRDLANEPAIDPQFPEIVIRGAAAMLPALQQYVDSPPTRFSHYGGYYTMTEENWPLIGPAGPDGSYVVAALSGFGSMTACAAGRLCAAHICGGELPSYAEDLSIARYDDTALMRDLLGSADRGLL